MRTVQMTLDERLVERVDRAARKLGKCRSSFTRDALRDALSRLAVQEKERRHRRGYEAPVTTGEFDDWSKEQVWPIAPAPRVQCRSRSHGMPCARWSRRYS